MLLDNMIGKYKATDDEVKEAANFAGCYMVAEGFDTSLIAFEKCYGDEIVAAANLCKLDE